MSYPTHRHPRDREHSYYEDDEQERGVEGRGRSHLGERGEGFRGGRPGEREFRSRERFGERRYMDPYSGRGFGREEDERDREYAPRQRGFAPYPYGEEPTHRDLEDWQQPWQLREPRRYPDYGMGYTRERGRSESGSAQLGGPYRGRGPKDYQRSDERLREDICERLTEDPSIDATEIHIEVSAGEVTLSGTVPDRRMKRAAEDVAEECSGVKQVHNGLRVQSERAESSEPDRYRSGARMDTRH